MSTFRCAHCGSVNRVRAASPDRAVPVCGRCKRELDVSGEPQEVGPEALEAAVRTSPVPVLVDFWAPWCGPCHMAAPIVHGLAREHAGRLLVLEVNSDEERLAATAHGIRAVPTFLLFSDGAEVARRSGVMRREQMERWILEGERTAAFPGGAP